MFKSLTFALAFAATMIVSPSAKYQKEIVIHPATLVDVAFADVAPCPEPLVLVTIKPIEVKAPVIHKRVVKVKPKPKKEIIKKKTPKKKHVAAHPKPGKHKSHAPDHHKSIPSHGSHGPTKIPTSHAPLHLTGPPGCA